jgi:hypothetical protein
MNPTIPIYFSPTDAVGAKKNFFGEMGSKVKSLTNSGFIKNLIVTIVLVFVSIACIMNLVAYSKIRTDYVDNRTNYYSYYERYFISPPSTTWPAIPPPPEQSISEGALVFGIVGNSIILVISLVALGFILYGWIKGKDNFEKGIRKIVRQAVTGAKISADKAIDEVVSNTDLDPNDINGSKTFLISSLKLQLDNKIERYMDNLVSTIEE